MKKFKYIIALFAIFICNQTFAGEVDLGTGKIFTDDNYLQYDNGVFLGKKQVDTSIIVPDQDGKYFGYNGRPDSSRINSFVNTYNDIIKTNQYDDYSYNNFYNDVSTKTSFEEFLYNNSAYYSFDTDIKSNIKKITDFNGNEMIYTGSITDSGSSIKIYYKSFLNKTIKNQRGNDIYYYDNTKYNNEYVLNSNNINIYFDNLKQLTLNFKANIPNLTTDNTIINTSEKKYLVSNNYGDYKYSISSNSYLSGSILLKNGDYSIDQSKYIFLDDGKKVSFNYINNNINFIFYKNYDYNNLNYDYTLIDSAKFLENNVRGEDLPKENGSTEWYNRKGKGYIDEYLGLFFNTSTPDNSFTYCIPFSLQQGDNETTTLDFNLYKFDGEKYILYTKKYNTSIKKYTKDDGISTGDFGICGTFTGTDDGVYKVRIKSVDTVNHEISKALGIDYSIKTLDTDDIVVVKNDKAMKSPYDSLETTFFDYKNINTTYFYIYKDFFENFSFKIRTSTGNILFEGTKSDLNNFAIKVGDSNYLINLSSIVNNIDSTTEYSIQIDYKIYGLPKSKIVKKYNSRATSKDVSKYKSFGESAWLPVRSNKNNKYTEEIQNPYIISDDYNSSGALLRIELPGLSLSNDRFYYNGSYIPHKYIFKIELIDGTIIDINKSDSCDDKPINNFYLNCSYYDKIHREKIKINPFLLTDISYKNKIKSINIYTLYPDSTTEFIKSYSLDTKENIVSKLKTYVLNTIQTSIYGFYDITDYFIDSQDETNILFIRKMVMNSLSANTSNPEKYKIKLNITGENLTKIDKSKIFICKDDTLTAQDISDGLGGCVNYEDIEKYDIQTEGLFIYALKSAFNTDYETLNINYDFKVYY